jgi:FAD/FMN-containing dehydrogenase/Fe-S oxidoreductase
VDRPQPERIGEDLKGVVKGELLFDEFSRVLFSTDASIFQVDPLGIVVPRDEEDVRAVVRYAAENHIPVVPRGGGSGVAGETLGAGLILDFSQHCQAVLAIGSDTVRVQPGVVHRDLNVVLAGQGRRFAPDPASGAQCTIGGMVATNASGARLAHHGYTRDHVMSLRAVLDTGEVIVAGRHSRWPRAEARPGRLEDIVSSVATLLDQNAETIRACQPRTPFNRCGYLLDDVLRGDTLDLARLLTGSEGTLAVFTEATLRTLPLPGGRAVVLLAFDQLDTALQAVRLVQESGPVACELLERRLLTLVRGVHADAANLVPPGAGALLLVEFEADSLPQARAVADDLTDRLHRQERIALHALVAVTEEDIQRFWALREAALPSLYGLRGAAQPVPFIEDVGVPPETLPVYLHRVQTILRRHETTASFLIHALTGQVHTRPFIDLAKAEEVARLLALADEVYSEVLDLGGTISAQHGTGLARTPWVSRQYGRLYPVFRELKAVFDPRHILNPGKIIGPDPGQPPWPFRNQGGREEHGDAPQAPRAPPSASVSQKSRLSLRWQPGEMAGEAASCNGCGQCRTREPVQRMCPIFRATSGEAAAPRAKANLMRYLLRPEADPLVLSSDEARVVCDLCVNCKMCARECPAHVNVPRLMLEAKAANVVQHGLHRTDWLLARSEAFARLGSAAAPLVNAALTSRPARWLLEKCFGIARQRRLPTFAHHSFLRLAARRGWTRRPHSLRPRVAYFVDVFANYNDPLIGEAVVAVLQHNGIEVFVPPGQKGCGMAPLALGDVESAREALQHNLRLFADLVREGYPVLCSEPTAAVMFCHDAPALFDDPDTHLVAGQTVEFTTFLWRLHSEGRLRTDFQPLDLAVGHHVPCHLKALGHPAAAPALLALIPGLRVHTIDMGCSGMAGVFGLKADNYNLSLRAGQAMLDQMGRPSVLHGSTECSACRMQIENSSGKRTLHPAEYLALAYGLLPEVGRRLHEPIREHVL